MVIFEHTVPAIMIWLGVCLALAVIGYSFWRYLKLDIPTIILLVLRVFFIALLIWCLFLPELKRSLKHMLKPRFVVAIDTSKSMLLTPSEDVSNRWSVTKMVLHEPWKTIIASECDIDVYTFATELGPRIDMAESDNQVPDGLSTLLCDSLRKLTDRYKGQNVAGFLLLSDGIDTREAYDDWAGESWPWPIYTVSLEPRDLWEVEPDLRVDAVKTPRRVTVGWTTELKAIVSGQGTKGQAANVQLFENNVLVQEVPTQIPVEGGAKEVSFQLEHPQQGVFTYTVFVPPLPKESHTNDNTYAVSVQVIDTKNRLLYVEGPPRWESKYLLRALKANSQITPLCFIQGPNKKFLTIGPRGSMTPDMTESHLTFFKIVLLGNLDAEELGEQRAMNLLKFVDTGGSLVLLGGPKAWGTSGFSKTPLKKLLPVKMKSHMRKPIEGKYPVMLTEAGQSHPAFAGDKSLWEVIPPVLSVFPDVALSAGAEALVGANTSSGVQPLIVAQRYGQGKVVAVLTDSLWRWKLSPAAKENKPYQRFWNQLISWLSPAEEELAPEQLDIFADREQMFLGEEIELSARLGGNREKPANAVTVNCEITTPDKRGIPFLMAKQHVITPSGKSFPGFAVKFTAQLPGLHTATAITEIGGKKIESDPVSFFVKPFTPESIPRPANIEVLKALARKSNGKFFDELEDLNETLSSLQFKSSEEESVKYSSLWQNLLIISCLLAFLSVEWGIRKWRNMP